ncbi:MAG: hypothetical protein ACI857_002531, partial [Arenicella sp.]
MKTLESKVIGTLTQNEKLENLWEAGAHTLGLLEVDLPISFMIEDEEEDPTFMEDADKAIKNFLELNGFYKLKIANPVFENFVEYCSYIGEDEIPEKMKGAQPLSIWNFIQPTQVFVRRRDKNDRDIYVLLACECAWEQEHGLQLVFRQGTTLTRVSDQ